MVSDVRSYPVDAYAPTGEPWWKLTVSPGAKKAKFGAERRIAAWLAYHKAVGDTFTTSELRAELGEDDVPNDQEHFQRRLRELRKDGWDIPSVKYDRNLEVGFYRVDKLGWHPGLGTPRPKKQSVVDAVTARKVFDRDGRRCKGCGVGHGEPHPRNNNKPAVMTVGHVKAGIFGGPGDLSNLRTECTICNEPLRSDAMEPPSIDEMSSAMRNLRAGELRDIATWIEAGYRVRSRADEFYDNFRAMAPGDQERIAAALMAMVKRN
ncbi:HNH endonuclease [Amycolatopsis sacchari]|uniref:HNH endonuclease n=1 Tax=Amycolatopsis sacchari TaxID=115433 RepID=UPI003EBE722A